MNSSLLIYCIGNKFDSHFKDEMKVNSRQITILFFVTHLSLACQVSVAARLNVLHSLIASAMGLLVRPTARNWKLKFLTQ